MGLVVGSYKLVFHWAGSPLGRCVGSVLQYAKMILPHIGLVLLLSLYTVFGALVFHFLEQPQEATVKRQFIDALNSRRHEYGERLWNMSQNYSAFREDWDALSREYWEGTVTECFKAAQTQLVKHHEIINNDTSRFIWTFEASIFFATTIITTIGYGQMAPITTYGRIFCIVFGLFGIPLLLVTIADIGKFLSDFLSFLYRSYRGFARRIRRQSRRLSRKRSRSRNRSQSDSPDKANTPNPISEDDDSEASSEDELRIPIVMVMFVLVGYTALGGLLFQIFEGWPYFEAFYFCFITMATIGFGDLVPSEQVYMFFTMAYIVVGLALATMCIDLAGTEYIRKIHFVGQKIESAKEVMGVGLSAGQQMLKHTGYGFIRTAGGKLIHVGRRHRGGYLDDFIDDDILEERNILYEPLSPRVLRHIKGNIKLMPDEINDKDGYVLQNLVYNKPPSRRHHYFSPELIQRHYRPASLRRSGSEPVLLIPPFLLKESHV